MELSEKSKEVVGPKLSIKNNIVKKMVKHDEEDDQSVRISCEGMMGQQGSDMTSLGIKENGQPEICSLSTFNRMNYHSLIIIGRFYLYFVFFTTTLI
jgi:hypothetical protein